MSPTRGRLRGLRAASLGVVGFSLALVAHLAAGGAAPGPVALLLLLVGFILTRKTRSTRSTPERERDPSREHPNQQEIKQ